MATTNEQQPRGVLVGVGGDPLCLGLPVFGLASVALGMGLIGMPAGLALVAPIVIISAGIFQIIATRWAILLGQTIVAVIFGIFSGLWMTLGFVLIGIHHGWFGIPAGGTTAALQLVFIAYACLIFFLSIPCLRLPAIYFLTMLTIVACLACAAAGLMHIAGYLALAFAFQAFWEYLNVVQTAVGAKKAWPPLGKSLIGG